MVKANDLPPVMVLYEGPRALRLDAGLACDLLAALLDRGYTVERIGDGEARRVAAGSFVVLGDFGGKRVSTSFFSSLLEAGQSVVVRDMADCSLEEILAGIEQTTPRDGLNVPGERSGWKPWFPVIDYDRCTNCMQCLTFCLFDVYSVDAGKQITVQNNANCKTNCPACSRVCPEVAIMFPKYAGSPINGDIVSEEDLGREKMKVDISSLLGGDIYASLRSRSERAKSRFSAERDADKALNERKRCLKKLQAEGMIPADVLAGVDLASLPSADEIRRRAEAVEELLDGEGR
jgi:Pyruvate/2-oxoacid:ferredoxin oxidoreductase delta subunit